MATGAVVVAATSGSSVAAAAAASSGKLLVVGALFGSALTLGLTLAVVRVAPTAVPRRLLLRETVDTAVRKERSSEEALPIQLTMDTPSLQSKERAFGTHPTAAKATPSGAPGHVVVEDPLMREAALVAEARGALVRADAESALSSLDAARRVGSRDLEPEEMSLRVRALRALGRDSEAGEIEGTLRSRYPDHFLSR